MVKPWPRLPREAVAAPSLAVLKARLNGALSNLGWWKMSLLMAGGLEPDDFQGPFQPKPFYDSVKKISCQSTEEPPLERAGGCKPQNALHMEEERDSSQPCALQLEPVLGQGFDPHISAGPSPGILNWGETVGYRAKCEHFSTFFELCSWTPLSITVGVSVHFAGSACGVSHHLAP